MVNHSKQSRIKGKGIRRRPRVSASARLPKETRRAEQFRRLAQAVAAAPRPAGRTCLSHADCQSALEFYLDAENRGLKAHVLYPAVWQHLQRCQACRLSYRILIEALHEPSAPQEASRFPMGKELDLPFTVHSDELSPWIKHIRSRIGGAPLGFGLSISPAHIGKLFAPVSLEAAQRSPISADAKSLLLFETFVLGRQQIDVEVWSQQTQDPSEIQLSISLLSPSPLPEPLFVTICWNDHQMSCRVQRGQAVFEKTSLRGLKSAHDLHIAFESKEPEEPAEDQHDAPI